PRKTRFRLLVRLYRTGLVTRRVPSERFHGCNDSPFPSFLGARSDRFRIFSAQAEGEFQCHLPSRKNAIGLTPRPARPEIGLTPKPECDSWGQTPRLPAARFRFSHS